MKLQLRLCSRCCNHCIQMMCYGDFRAVLLQRLIKTRRMSCVLLGRVRLPQCSDSSRVTREHPFQLSRVYIAKRIQYCISGTTYSYFVLFCQSTAHRIIRNNVLSACVRRMHTFRLYDVTLTLVKR